MKLATRGLSVLAAVAALAIGGATATASAAPATASKSTVASTAVTPSTVSKSTYVHHKTVRQCGAAKARHMTCFAIRQTDTTEPAGFKVQAVVPNATPSGYGPTNLASAYKLSNAAGGGQTSGHRRRLQRSERRLPDLAVYRSQYGLPACYSCEWMLPAGQPERRYQPPAWQTTPAGPVRNPSTSTWCRRSARSVTSFWSRQAPRPMRT